MKKNTQISSKRDGEDILLYPTKKNIKRKKIYFDTNGTEVKIGYDDQTGIGFVEIISE